MFPSTLYNLRSVFRHVWAEQLLTLQNHQPKGPTPSFSTCHLILTVLNIGNNFVGRKKLAEDVGVGEGTIRTIIGRLRSAHLVSTQAAGCSLTEKGLELFNQIKEDIEFFTPPAQLPIYGKSAGLLLHGMSRAILNGLKERDEAVRSGAIGAMIMTYEGGRLIMPGLTDVTKEHPEEASLFESQLGLREGDVVIITWAHNFERARCSALEAGIAAITAKSTVN